MSTNSRTRKILNKGHNCNKIREHITTFLLHLAIQDFHDISNMFPITVRTEMCCHICEKLLQYQLFLICQSSQFYQSWTCPRDPSYQLPYGIAHIWYECILFSIIFLNYFWETKTITLTYILCFLHTITPSNILEAFKPGASDIQFYQFTAFLINVPARVHKNLQCFCCTQNSSAVNKFRRHSDIQTIQVSMLMNYPLM